MMTTKKRRRSLPALAVIAAAGTILTACSPPGGKDLREGERAIKAGHFDAAIARLTDATRVLSMAPPAVQSKAWNLLGLAYQGAGRLDPASQAYLKALKLDNNYEAVDFNLGCLRMQQGNFPGAIDYLTTSVALYPRRVGTHLKLGAAHYHLALERTGAERTRQMENARLEFETAEKLSPTAEAANAIGIMELQRRNGGAEAVRAAAAAFQTALERDPRYGPALLDLAIVNQQYFNRLPAALKLYRQYLALQPPPPYAREIAKLAAQVDLDSRITIGRDANERPAPPPRATTAPSNPAPLPAPRIVPLAAPTSKVANPVAAPPPALASQAAAAPALAPSPPPTPPPKSAAPEPLTAPAAQPPSSVNTATPPGDLVAREPIPPPPAPAPRKTFAQRLNPLHWFSSTPKTAKETAPVSKSAPFNYPPRVTSIPGNRREAERLAGVAAQARQEGHLEEALHDYRDALAADPTYFGAGLSLGLTAIDAGDYDTALDALYFALGLDENSASARYAFAWTLQKRGYYADAARELEKLLAAHPDEARGHLLLATLEAEKLGEPKRARQHYARVLELDPGNSQAPAIRAWIQKTP